MIMIVVTVINYSVIIVVFLVAISFPCSFKSY